MMARGRGRGHPDPRVPNYSRPLNKTGSHCGNPLIHGFCFYPSKFSRPLCHGLSILRFNQPQIENSVFQIPTPVSQPWTEDTVFNPWLVGPMDQRAKCRVSGRTWIFDSVGFRTPNCHCSRVSRSITDAQAGQCRKLIKKNKRFIWNVALDGGSVETPNRQKDEQVGATENSA